MKNNIYILLLLFCANLNAQNLEEEIGFLYTKAQYLMSTDRSEDAIKVLNQIIAEDHSYEDAALMRAEAKFALGAYAGVRKDLNLFISNNGITPRAARLYGLADFQGGKKEAALNSLTMAAYEIKDDKLLYETKAGLLENKGMLLQACKDYRRAAELGSAKAKRKANELCGEMVSSEERKKKRSERNKKKYEDKILKKEKADDMKEEMEEEEVIVMDDKKEEEEKDVISIDFEQEEMEEKPDKPEPKAYEIEEDDEDEEDTTVNEIVVDEELTLLISGEGLGSREVMNQPNILILSDKSGTVAIDICVSRGGRVSSATFDNINSTIKKQSLVSLAVRKAKEFWFDAGIGNDKCGKLVFQITSGT
jgi:tetratricopeptide (TPR) repeat protein